MGIGWRGVGWRDKWIAWLGDGDGVVLGCRRG